MDNTTPAQGLAEAFHRLTTGDQTPPRPWAYLSRVGVEQVSPLAALAIEGFSDTAGFDVTTRDGTYRVMVSRL